MATVQPAAPTHQVRRGVEPLRAGQGTSFIWRKLHSLLGIVPIGAFLLEHLLSNFEALKGPIAYGEQVKFLNSLPLVRVLEWVFIFLPILYHGIYGVYIWLRGKSNIVYYPWAGNWMYLAQRYTGLIAFAYIAYHVATQRFMGVSLPENPGMAFAKVQHELANPWILAVYVIAMIASAGTLPMACGSLPPSGALRREKLRGAGLAMSALCWAWCLREWDWPASGRLSGRSTRMRQTMCR